VKNNSIHQLVTFLSPFAPFSYLRPVIKTITDN
jgi:hypothetical protein